MAVALRTSTISLMTWQIAAKGQTTKERVGKMSDLQPITEDELQTLIREQLAECEPKQHEVFEQYRVPVRKVPLERYGEMEEVFVAAQRGDEVMYYEDVEEGFNFSPVDEQGVILEHWCNQDELKYALLHWMGEGARTKRGPAKPTTPGAQSAARDSIASTVETEHSTPNKECPITCVKGAGTPAGSCPVRRNRDPCKTSCSYLPLSRACSSCLSPRSPRRSPTFCPSSLRHSRCSP